MILKFPPNFIFGTAISAFQTEMGMSEDSIVRNSDWFEWVHNEKNIKEGIVSGDFPEHGDGFWDLYREDINNAKYMGNNSIRLSIEWPRIFPESTEKIYADVQYENGNIVSVFLPENDFKEMLQIANQNAIEHYKEIFTYIKEAGLSILLTLYHWPLPSWLHDPIRCHEDIETCGKRGWLDDRTIIEFGKYAQFISNIFSKFVDVWETINEPDVIASQGYFFGNLFGFPPGISDMNKAFKVEKNLALAHNVAYKNIKIKNKSKDIGIGIAPQYFEPVTGDQKTKNFVNYVKYLNNEWFLNAVNYGMFDNDLDMVYDERLVEMVPPDYIGIDYYQRVRIGYKDLQDVPYIFNMDLFPCENCSDFMWDIYPEGIRYVTNELFERYHRKLYILENGIADEKDEKRSRFLVNHLIELKKSIEEDKLPIVGYYHWSLMDNYEWARGFKMRFGLYRVNYNTKERTPTKAVEIYRKICRGEEIYESEL